MLKTMMCWAMTAFVISGAMPAGAAGFGHKLAAPVPNAGQNTDVPPAEYIKVRRRGDSAPQILAGVIVHAAAEDLDRFDDVARLYGIRMERLPDGKEVASIALFLVQHLRRDAVFDLYRQALGGALGALRVEAMIVAPEDIRPGVKPTDIIRVIPADELELP